MKNGVPFSVALGQTSDLEDVERSAMAIIFSEFEGNKFKWQTLSWETQSQ